MRPTKQERMFRCIDKEMSSGLTDKKQEEKFCELAMLCMGKAQSPAKAKKLCRGLQGNSEVKRFERCVLHVKHDIWSGKADIDLNPYAVCHASIG